METDEKPRELNAEMRIDNDLEARTVSIEFPQNSTTDKDLHADPKVKKRKYS